jgi:hypothetical protein
MGAASAHEFIPVPGEDRKGLHIGNVVKARLEGRNSSRSR